MATEALDKLREFACMKSCQDAIEVLGMHCIKFDSCEDCGKAANEAAAELVADVERRLLPEGVAWPRFEDGGHVEFGDSYVDSEGTVRVVKTVGFRSSGDGCVSDGKSFHYFDGSTVFKRPEPADTQERIDEDAGKTPCEYFGRKGRLCSDGDGCPSLEMDGSCDAAKTRDILRRQRELDAKEAGR